MSKPILIVRHMPHEAGGSLETALALAGLEFRYIDVFLDVPKHLPLDQAAAMVVLGGAMNVDEVDRYPFLAADVLWIRQALAAEIPLMGICLGAQLLAKALGARVYANRVKEIGWYPLDLTPAAAADPLFAQLEVQTAFQWHGDTFDLPVGAIQLARSPLCAIQAFRYGSRAYGLQFHLEMTAGMIDNWLAEAGNSEEMAQLEYVDPMEIRARTPLELPRLQTVAGEVFRRFADMCRAY
jgi:GMP synthase (glutamine-hydrolysing)